MKFIQHRTPLQGKENIETDSRVYINALRSELLSKGKPFDEVYLKREDVYVLEDLLSQCGYSPDRIDQLMSGLLDNCHDGEIKLSQFFAQIQEIGPPKQEEPPAILLDASMIPHVESVLSDFNLSQNEISRAINIGRTAGGELSLEKLIEGIEIVGRHAIKESRGSVDPRTSPQVIESLESLGFQIPEEKQTDVISIEDFIHTLKQMAKTTLEVNSAADHQALNPQWTENRALNYQSDGDRTVIRLNTDDLRGLNIQVSQNENPPTAILENETVTPGEISRSSGDVQRLPSEVTAAIDRILEKLVIPDQTDDSLTAIIMNSKIKFDDPGSKTINMAGPFEGRRPVAPLAQNETLSSSNHEGEHVSGSQPAENMRTILDLGTNPGEDDAIPSETGQRNGRVRVLHTPPQDILYQGRPAIDQAVENNPPRSVDSLPNYLIDQMGRQIARSVTRGDGVVRFQLKPPELGIVRLEMNMTDSQLNLSVTTENSTTKELMLTHIQELRETLQGQGIRLDRIDVQINDDFNQTLSNLHDGAEREHGSNRDGGRRPSFIYHEDMQEGFPESDELSDSDSIVNLVA